VFHEVKLRWKISWDCPFKVNCPLYVWSLLLHNGGFCNACITERCLHLHNCAFHLYCITYNSSVINDYCTLKQRLCYFILLISIKSLQKYLCNSHRTGKLFCEAAVQNPPFCCSTV
jgi:hypothetical protein